MAVHTKDPKGLYQKYNVTPKSGEDKGGPYFVLAYDRDPHAAVALSAYADSVESENPGLAADLRAALS